MNEVSESNQVGDEVLLPVTRNPREPAQISLVTWNLNLWKHEDQELESNVEDVLGLLTELEPDFVGFQEVNQFFGLCSSFWAIEVLSPSSRTKNRKEPYISDIRSGIW